MGTHGNLPVKTNEERPAPKICCVCGAVLAEKAIYCKECSNYQSPLRRALSGINLSELTALISSGALAFAFLNVHILHRSAEIGFTPLACTDDKFEIAILNEGSRPAVLERAFATRTIDGVADGRGPVEIKASPTSDRIFQMGKGRTLSFTTEEEGFPPKPMSTKHCYSVELQTTEFSGKSQTETKPCPCA